MELAEIEKILQKADTSRTAVIKAVFTSDVPLKKNVKGEVVLFEGVPAELLEFRPPNQYLVLFKAGSMRAYIRKQKEKINEKGETCTQNMTKN